MGKVGHETGEKRWREGSYQGHLMGWREMAFSLTLLKCLLWARSWSKCFRNANSFNPPDKPVRHVHLLFLLSRWGNWCPLGWKIALVTQCILFSVLSSSLPPFLICWITPWCHALFSSLMTQRDIWQDCWTPHLVQLERCKPISTLDMINDCIDGHKGFQQPRRGPGKLDLESQGNHRECSLQYPGVSC